jgi:hypothetical protein
MKKIVLAGVVLGCALLVNAQNGYAHPVMSQGCIASGCHAQANVHPSATHHVSMTCDQCHQTAAGGGDAYPSKCIVCHPRSPNTPGKCNLTKRPTHAASGGCSAVGCHADCKSTCPAAKVLGDEDPRLIQLRTFRDNVLAKSAFGQRIIDSYYNNADSINAALDKNPTLKAYSYKALQSFIPVLEIFM